MTSDTEAAKYFERTLAYFKRDHEHDEAWHLATIELRGFERGIQHERAKSEKLVEALEAIRWSWENDAGRQCDNIAADALAAYRGEK